MARSQIANRKSKIVISGGGPAGSSLAIRLAKLGFETTLIEREQFPRAKLCGEFISPECLEHFDELGVLEEMLSAGGDQITETRFFELGGRSVGVASSWFGRGEFALSLSRATMDHLLLERAKQVGVSVYEETSVTGVESDGDQIISLHARTSDGSVRDIAGEIFIDATGRARVLAKLADRKLDTAAAHVKPDLIGFKAHLETADVPKGVCEIYSFQNGYGGLSRVEDDRFNFCFLMKASAVRSFGGDADEIVRDIVGKNKRAAVTLGDVAPHHDWLAVSIDGFGARRSSPARNLFAVGDSASFIDPFTGSGMFMAFQSSALLANAIAAYSDSPDRIASEYLDRYGKTFSNRHRVCWVLRQTAFVPVVATTIVSALSLSTSVRQRLARATRG
ncbi:MAG: hypothetical protein DMF63_15085 [Acidobacteria bacterium]|nr:MAG: hypothetical protein DMF63_15085 [Acidobacteriota bacterium]